jgi:cell division septum initiation protein DivIVA
VTATPAPTSDVNPDELFDIAGELDRWFETSRRRTSRPPPSHRSDRVTTNEDLNSVRDLFNDMAVHYVGQVRDFMLELRRAEASTTWIPLCEPAVQKLRTMCDSLAMPDLCQALDEFSAALEHAKNVPRGIVQGARRDELLQAYEHMIALLPRAFELGTGREAMIVQLLLMRVPGVHGLTIEKLYRAGLHEFDSYFRASPAELAAVAGIDVSLARRIVQLFREYRQRVSAVLAEPAPAQERGRVAELTEKLREQHDAFERAAAEWSGEARAAKRKLRQERQQTLADIYVALARLGETERVAALQKMSIGKQLEDVEDYLRQFRGSFGAPL